MLSLHLREEEKKLLTIMSSLIIENHQKQTPKSPPFHLHEKSAIQNYIKNNSVEISVKWYHLGKHMIPILNKL